MRKRYDVIWAQTAEKDLIDIIEYIAAGNPAIACEIFLKIKKRAANLATFPERCRIVPELHDQGIIQYRELIISPWRIIFRIAEKGVFIMSMLDSRQNIEDVLLKKLIS
jgi:toxin ParE1/3/4